MFRKREKYAQPDVAAAINVVAGFMKLVEDSSARFDEIMAAGKCYGSSHAWTELEEFRGSLKTMVAQSERFAIRLVDFDYRCKQVQDFMTKFNALTDKFHSVATTSYDNDSKSCDYDRLKQVLEEIGKAISDYRRMKEGFINGFPTLLQHTQNVAAKMANTIATLSSRLLTPRPGASLAGVAHERDFADLLMTCYQKGESAMNGMVECCSLRLDRFETAGAVLVASEEWYSNRVALVVAGSNAVNNEALLNREIASLETSLARQNADIERRSAQVEASRQRLRGQVNDLRNEFHEPRRRGCCSIQ